MTNFKYAIGGELRSHRGQLWTITHACTNHYNANIVQYEAKSVPEGFHYMWSEAEIDEEIAKGNFKYEAPRLPFATGPGVYTLPDDGIKRSFDIIGGGGGGFGGSGHVEIESMWNEKGELVYESRKNPLRGPTSYTLIPVCTCDMTTLMRQGCACGHMKVERARK